MPGAPSSVAMPVPLVASLLLVAMAGAPSSVLPPSSDAWTKAACAVLPHEPALSKR